MHQAVTDFTEAGGSETSSPEPIPANRVSLLRPPRFRFYGGQVPSIRIIKVNDHDAYSRNILDL